MHCQESCKSSVTRMRDGRTARHADLAAREADSAEELRTLNEVEAKRANESNCVSLQQIATSRSQNDIEQEA